MQSAFGSSLSRMLPLLEEDVHEAVRDRLELAVEPEGLEWLCECTDWQSPPVSEGLPVGDVSAIFLGAIALEVM